MIDLMNPPCSVVRFSDGALGGLEGVQGWWSDDLIDGKRVIFFEGTGFKSEPNAPMKGYGDVWADLWVFPQSPYWNPRYRLHGGFYTWFTRAWAVTTYFRATNKPLVFMGHSLGAAIAAICAINQKQLFPSFDIDCILFSLPTALGNRRFCKDFQKLFPYVQNHSVGWDPTQWIHFISKPLFGLGSPVKTINYPYEHNYRFDWKHPIQSLKWLIDLMLLDHLPSSIKQYVPNLFNK